MSFTLMNYYKMVTSFVKLSFWNSLSLLSRKRRRMKNFSRSCVNITLSCQLTLQTSICPFYYGKLQTHKPGSWSNISSFMTTFRVKTLGEESVRETSGHTFHRETQMISVCSFLTISKPRKTNSMEEDPVRIKGHPLTKTSQLFVKVIPRLPTFIPYHG